jgi:hypothetical protein
MATKMVLACGHSRSLQLLARLAARTEFKILEHSLKGGVEAGRAHHCKINRTRLNAILEPRRSILARDLLSSYGLP